MRGDGGRGEGVAGPQPKSTAVYMEPWYSIRHYPLFCKAKTPAVKTHADMILI